MLYSLQIKQSALKEIQGVPKPDRQRIIAAIDKLAVNPHVGKLLKGDYAGLRRIRASDYRVVYEINEGQVLVLALRVARRKHVYR